MSHLPDNSQPYWNLSCFWNFSISSHSFISPLSCDFRFPHHCIKITLTKFISHLVAKSNESILILIILIFATFNHSIFCPSDPKLSWFSFSGFLTKLPTCLCRFLFPPPMLAFLRVLAEILLSVHAKPSFLGELIYSHDFNYHPVLDKAGNQIWVHILNSDTLH